MKILFLGTPEFGVNVLEKIVSSRHKVVGVICQPDRMNGRGNKVTFCPVKERALQLGLPVYQYEKINENVPEISSLGADIMVTCAYGQILRQELLDLCEHGIINVHASLLPKYRGSSPVEWALINGEKNIGVSIMQTSLGVDTGDIILQKSIPLTGEENASEALEKLSFVGADLIEEALDLIEEGKATFTKQEEEKATKTRMFTKEDGKIDFSLSAERIHNYIRGITPRPGAYAFCSLGRMKILKTAVVCFSGGKEIGEVVLSSVKEGLIVRCGEGYLKIERLQAESGKPLDVREFLLGKKIEVGSLFS